MGFASYRFLPGAESSHTARRNCYCLAGGWGSDSLGESLSLRIEEERKPRGYLLAYLLTRVDVATMASMRLGAPGRVLETNTCFYLRDAMRILISALQENSNGTGEGSGRGPWSDQGVGGLGRRETLGSSVHRGRGKAGGRAGDGSLKRGKGNDGDYVCGHKILGYQTL